MKFFNPDPALPLSYETATLEDETDLIWNVKEQPKEEDADRRKKDLGFDWDILRMSGPLVTEMKGNGQYTVWLAWSLPPTEHLYSGMEVLMHCCLFYVSFLQRNRCTIYGTGGYTAREIDKKLFLPHFC